MKHLRCTEPDGSELGTSTWRNGSMKLIDVLISASNIQGPDAFFLFPGKSCAALGKFSNTGIILFIPDLAVEEV